MDTERTWQRPGDATSAVAGIRAGTLVRDGEVYVFRYLPTRAGRFFLYSALADHLRRGLIRDEDVHQFLLSQDPGS